MNIRHGDLGLITNAEIEGNEVRFDTLPDGLAPSPSNVLMVGSHGNNHSFQKGTFYPHSEANFPTLIGYFVADPGCLLIHIDHGIKSDHGDLRTATVPPGISGVFRQHEERHSGMEPVVD